MTVSEGEAVTYVRDTALALTRMTEAFGLDSLTYLLQMAALEADNVLNKTSESAALPEVWP
jgi:hypothetical protein